MNLAFWDKVRNEKVCEKERARGGNNKRTKFFSSFFRRVLRRVWFRFFYFPGSFDCDEMNEMFAGGEQVTTTNLCIGWLTWLPCSAVHTTSSSSSPSNRNIHLKTRIQFFQRWPTSQRYLILLQFISGQILNVAYITTASATTWIYYSYFTFCSPHSFHTLLCCVLHRISVQSLKHLPHILSAQRIAQ